MLKKINILIIDDQKQMLEPLFDVLYDCGHEVTIVDNGYQGIDLIKKRYFDIALVDLQMPGINGLDTFREIKKISPSTSVIMMTGASVEEMMKQAIEEGAVAVAHKPFKINKLLEKIEDIAQKPVILVVDDIWEDRETLKDILSSKYKVLTAKDGDEAINMVQHGNINTVFLDVRMPGKNGIDTLEAIKKFRKDIGVIMTTGYDMEESLVNSIKNDAFTILYKPFNIEKVFKILESKDVPQKSTSTRLLVVDDDVNLRETLVDILTDENYDVISVSTGKEAIEKSKTQFFQVVITDYHLSSDMTGLDVIKELKKINEDLYTILITGQASLDMAVQAIKEGVYDYLVKPVNPDTLKKTLKKALENQHLVVENKKLFKELKKVNTELKKLDELKSKFLSMVTHELRTPLASIKGYTQLLHHERKGPLNDEQKKTLEKVERESDHLNSLITELLDLSKIEAGKLSLLIQPIFLDQVIDTVLSRIKFNLEKQEITFENNVPQKPISVLADPQRIDQVITNLLTNAIKHTSKGGKIGINFYEKDREIDLEIFDTGEGIPQEDLTKIFDRFYQVENSLNKASGLGLGLSIVKEILHLHNSTISVSSEGIGKGSKFWFTLPKTGTVAITQ